MGFIRTPEKVYVEYMSEDSLWQLLNTGQMGFNIRRYDLNDPRVIALGTDAPEKYVGFTNKVTFDVLVFEYLGMDIPASMPGWFVVKLGKRARLRNVLEYDNTPSHPLGYEADEEDVE